MFIAVALAQQAGQLRQLSLVAHGWWWLLLGLGLTWLSILINGLAWRDVLVWLRHPPRGLEVVPLFVRSNLLKYLPGGIWHLVERVRVLRPVIGGGPALAGVILDPLLIVAASFLVLVVGGWQQGLCFWPLARAPDDSALAGAAPSTGAFKGGAVAVGWRRATGE